MSMLLKRKETTLILVALSFLWVLSPYFLQIKALEDSANKFVLMVSVLNAMSILLAIYSQTKRSLFLVNQRAYGWPYQLYLIALVYVMAGIGFVFGSQSSQFMWPQYAILNPTSNVIYSILAFYMASACARAFRARSIQAALLLLSGVIVLIGQAPLSGVFFPITGDLQVYLTTTWGMAASRIFTMGVTIGAIVLGVRILTGNEAAAIGVEGG